MISVKIVTVLRGICDRYRTYYNIRNIHILSFLNLNHVKLYIMTLLTKLITNRSHFI